MFSVFPHYLVTVYYSIHVLMINLQKKNINAPVCVNLPPHSTQSTLTHSKCRRGPEED